MQQKFLDEEFSVVEGKRPFLEILSSFFNFAASQLLMSNRAKDPSLKNPTNFFPHSSSNLLKKVTV